jgi:hypothetical protein
MTRGFAASYIDRLFADRESVRLYEIVLAIGREEPLPEEFWLFCQLLQWASSTRSGVWQWYENLPNEEFDRMAKALDRFGMAAVFGTDLIRLTPSIGG